MLRLTCKQAAESWGISPTKVSQARDPAFRKVAQVMLDYPAEAMSELAYWMELVRMERGSISESELHTLTLMQTGRLDRKVLHPNGRR